MYLPECSFKDKLWWDAWEGRFYTTRKCPNLGGKLDTEEWIQEPGEMDVSWGGRLGTRKGKKRTTGTTWQRRLCHWRCQRRTSSCCWGKCEVNRLLNKPPCCSAMLLCWEWQLLGRVQEEGHLMTSGDIHWTLIITQENENRKLSLHCNSRN